MADAAIHGDEEEPPDISQQAAQRRSRTPGAAGKTGHHPLQAEGSPKDLTLRGFSQTEIIDRTGVDVGYHGCALRTSTRGIDRFKYKVEHVLARVDQPVVSAALAAYSEGTSKIGTLRLLGLCGENVVILRQLFAALGLAKEFAAADKASRRGNMASGMLARYGVDNPFELTEFQERAEQTRVARYGDRYTLSEGSSLAEAARASFVRHLADKSFAEDLRRRKTATTRARYGVDYPSQSLIVQAKTRATFRERYGVDHPSQRHEARIRQAAMARSDGKRRAAISRQTNLARYGVEYASQLPENRSRQSERMIRTHVARSSKARATTMRKYGVHYASQRQERRAAQSALMKTYGVEFAARSQMTTLNRYGVAHHSQTEERRKRQSQRMLDPDHQNRINSTKRANSSFNASGPEEKLHGLLAGYFGEGNVLRQYKDPRYPYRCDFYIASRDLFIELNGTWTHGGHWFDQDDPYDRQVVEKWRAKNSAYYNTSILQWCQRDRAKRNAAGAARLNYVTFWDGQRLDDARLWLALGAPDGCDWKQEYTWLPVRGLNLKETSPPSDEQPRGAAATETAGWQATCRRALEIWEDTRGTKWGTVRAVLYSDCYRLLGKLPHQLSDLEILQRLAATRLGHGSSTAAE